MKSIGYAADSSTLDELTADIESLHGGIAVLRAALDDEPSSVAAQAEHAGHKLLPAMEGTRAAVDKLEMLVADDLWPLATYQEMLFML
jgi:glutamine synthetase